MDIRYSIFSPLFGLTSLSGATGYNIFQLTSSGLPGIVSSAAHTGLRSLQVPNGTASPTNIYPMPMQVNNLDYPTISSHYNSYFPFGTYALSDRNEYLPFQLNKDKKYIISYWIKSTSYATATTNYTLPDSCGIRINGTFKKMIAKTNIIDGWQKVEAEFDVPSTVSVSEMRLPSQFYIDDVRLFPADANMKAFIYHPVNQKLLATLDENNFSTRYEYDDEGNLVRIKKETEKGIMTVSESRNGHPVN